MGRRRQWWPGLLPRPKSRLLVDAAGYGKTPGCNYHGSAGPVTDLADRKLEELVSWMLAGKRGLFILDEGTCGHIWEASSRIRLSGSGAHRRHYLRARCSPRPEEEDGRGKSPSLPQQETAH
ncbi:unnamed protein product [Staurois parvus]|uniref:Uncharacterized protein n=1 Tax=Staurois parvus TaxID=386267 RepID=A0ABN9ABZ5_9NEOB|nr:unnamed protein product [Staurois parvus]